MRTMYKGSRYTEGYKIIMHEFRMGDSGHDPYGEATSHLFGLATTAYVEYGVILPDFVPSPALFPSSHQRLNEYPDSLYQDYAQSHEIDLQDITDAFRVLSRYYDLIPEHRKY